MKDELDKVLCSLNNIYSTFFTATINSTQKAYVIGTFFPQ